MFPSAALPFAWLLICVSVLPSAAQQPPPAQDDEPPVVKKLRVLVKAKPLESAKDEDELRKLQKARYNSAVRGLGMKLQEFEAGRGTVEALVGSFRKVHDSKLELSPEPADQIGVREMRVELAKEVEKMVEVKIAEGILQGSGLLEDVRYARLEAEIQLLKAKRQAQRPPTR
jgi:hypothetical protein